MEIIKWGTVALLVVAVVLFAWACAKAHREKPAPAPEFKTTAAEKSLALGFTVDEIKYRGGPDIAYEDERWAVFPSPGKPGYYVALKPDAIWFVDAADNMKVEPKNEAAREIAPAMPAAADYDPTRELSYKELSTNLK
ncbi:MAG: hypothetical protein V3W11_12450 [bacterium]